MKNLLIVLNITFFCLNIAMAWYTYSYLCRFERATVRRMQIEAIKAGHGEFRWNNDLDARFRWRSCTTDLQKDTVKCEDCKEAFEKDLEEPVG